MPTYVYECSKCEKTFEVEQRITEAPLTDCSCGANGSVKRIIQPIAVSFKGSGFHINDYSGQTSGGSEKASAKAETCSGEPSSCPACSDPS